MENPNLYHWFWLHCHLLAYTSSFPLFSLLCIYIFGAIFLHITHWPHSVYIILIEMRADQLLLIYYHKITVFQQRGDRSRDRMVILCFCIYRRWISLSQVTDKLYKVVSSTPHHGRESNKHKITIRSRLRSPLCWKTVILW
jgi:hypothetical protein